MHPSFSSLFVHPESHKPLAFFGNVEDGDGIPVHVLSPAQTWPPLYVKKLREEKWIERNWENAGKMLKEESKLAEFAKRIAEGEGLILDVASGPGGGLASAVLRINPEATILMDDLSLGLLQEWQRFLRDKGILNVSFAAFDATKMPLKTNSMDIVSDLGGFDNIQGGAEAVKEAYRILKPGGTLFSVNGMIEREDFLKLPIEVRTKWYNTNPPSFDGFLEIFKRVGFKVICNTLLKERELSPDEGDLPREADKYGVRLHVKLYCTEVTKQIS